MSFIVSPSAKSWVKVDPENHFPIQNIPFGVAQLEDGFESPVSRIGDFVIDLGALIEEGLLPFDEVPEGGLYADLGREELDGLRKGIYDLLRESNPRLRDDKELRGRILIPEDQVAMGLPMQVTSFVDFYSGINHASNVGRMFRPEMPPLLPNYRHLPVGYNGRASSVVPADVPIFRPKGQTKAPDSDMPIFGPTRELDFELELGFFLATGNEFGESISVANAEEKMLGLVLVNDWSARDVQRWEYQPLGPFLAKSFATSISPWAVTLDALAPFRCKGQVQEPPPLPHLAPSGMGHFDIVLEVYLKTAQMEELQLISKTNSKELYWSLAQQLAHQTSNGTPTEAGDLYASGTISGSEEGSFGSMLELSWRGTKPLIMAETGEERRFIEDGDGVLMTGYCQGNGYRVGFGEVRNQVIPTL